MLFWWCQVNNGRQIFHLESTSLKALSLNQMGFVDNQNTDCPCNTEKCYTEQQKSYSRHCEASLLPLRCAGIPLHTISHLIFFHSLSLSSRRLPHSTIPSTKIPVVHSSPRIYKLKASSLRPRLCERNMPHHNYVNIVMLEHTYTTHVLHLRKFSWYQRDFIWQQNKIPCAIIPGRTAKTQNRLKRIIF